MMSGYREVGRSEGGAGDGWGFSLGFFLRFSIFPLFLSNDEDFKPTASVLFSLLFSNHVFRYLVFVV